MASCLSIHHLQPRARVRTASLTYIYSRAGSAKQPARDGHLCLLGHRRRAAALGRPWHNAPPCVKHGGHARATTLRAPDPHAQHARPTPPQLRAFATSASSAAPLARARVSSAPQPTLYRHQQALTHGLHQMELEPTAVWTDHHIAACRISISL